MNMSLGKKAAILVGVIILADQILKIWVKTHMCIGEEISLIGRIGFLYFVENPGMAFGMEFFGDVGKFLLTLFRMVFTGVLIWFTIKLIREKAPKGLIIGIAAMIAGAAGNLIDCLFYGVIFSESTYSSVAQIFPSEGGYAPFMFGNVVDMFYFPIIKGTWPSWVPGWGGSSFVFFRPIFNIADAAITVNVIYLLLFQRKPLLRELSTSSKRKKDEDSSVNNNME